MARVITIKRPEVVALVERVAARLTNGDKTAAVALGMRRLLDEEDRRGSLFGMHPGSVRVVSRINLIEPVLDIVPDAETGKEVER